ncbi:hypothetical protein WR25_18364 [Diploscapter pachys]|uniref:Histidine acid phosphatase n=1 Tax=Diploscapter pachys TaxID=2018661 RepID=A0A2A2JZ92_9BILA|nr:hypothetical protein WR25_18364 [Diploscapter pachys]
MFVRQRKTTFPFCSLAELRANKAKICFLDLQSPRRAPMQFVSTCEPINANVSDARSSPISSIHIHLAFGSLPRRTRFSESTDTEDDQVIKAEIDIPKEDWIPVRQRKLKKDDQMLFLQVIWRHGDRAPTGTYPTDPHKEESWPNGWGELTQLGMRQQYALGRQLFNTYINTSSPFLSRRYSSKEIYIRSTDVNRTLISAYSNLAGMFAEGVNGTDYPDYFRWPHDWTPIPVHTVDVDQDYIGNVFAPCPRADELFNQAISSPEYRKVEEENKQFLAFLSEKTGINITLPTIFSLNDVHHIELIYNMSQPEWLTPQVSTKIRELSQFTNMYIYGISKPYLPELIRLRGGSMLKAIVSKMRQKLSCHRKNNTGEDCSWMAKLKYYAYSAHDTTVAALLTTFGDERRVIRGGLPKYTASVAVELWDLVDEGPSVRILFHSAFHHKYHVITHLTKGCPEDKEFCPLRNFEMRSLKFMPVNIEKECRPQAAFGRKSDYKRNKLPYRDF